MGAGTVLATHVTIEDALLALENAEEAHAFLEAMLSPSEHDQLRRRWHAYQLRADGHSVSETAKEAHIAIATATRAAALRKTSPETLDLVLKRASKNSVSDTRVEGERS